MFRFAPLPREEVLTSKNRDELGDLHARFFWKTLCLPESRLALFGFCASHNPLMTALHDHNRTLHGSQEERMTVENKKSHLVFQVCVFLRSTSQAVRLALIGDENRHLLS